MITTMLFIKCQKSELVYSCDPEINRWVINNKQGVSKITRNELITYELEYQKAIYSSLEPSERFIIWIDKFHDLKNLDWTHEELLHLQLFEDNMKVEWFSNRVDRQKTVNDEFEFFTNSWIDYAINNLAWSQSLAYSILVRLDLPVKDNALVETTENNLYGSGKESGQGNCRCDTSDDWCDGILGSPDIADCKVGGCRPGSGCGTLWLGDCDGKCVVGAPSSN